MSSGVEREEVLGLFGKYLTLWVALCAVVGLALGNWFPWFPELLGGWTIPGTLVPIPIGICLFLMIYPILVRTQFERLKEAFRVPKPLALNVFFVWVVKPLTMFTLAWLLLKTLWGFLSTPWA